MDDKKRVIELVCKKEENEYCDFKREFYHEKKKADMIKDILSFANSPVSGDKYIIFNIDDETRELGNMSLESLHDISEINQIIRTNCEPFINIEMSNFLYKGANVAYIKIAANNTDRPYLVKKEYGKLQEGDIYIRKNANNFIANRKDLDQIYDSREKRIVTIDSSDILQKEYLVKNVQEKLFELTFIFENNSKYNFLLNQLSVKMNVGRHSFKVKGKYISDENELVDGHFYKMEESAYSIEPYTTIKRKVIFHMSDACIGKIRDNQVVNCNVTLEMLDVKGCEVKSVSKECSIVFK